MTARILLVEDEFILAEYMAEILSDRGYQIVGPFLRLKMAQKAAEIEPLHAAVLDVNLAGELVYPVADALADRGIPYAFVTAYDNAAMAPQRHRTVRTLYKPCDADLLGRLVDSLLNGG
jgi:DNA-binding NtrC family response regulator